MVNQQNPTIKISEETKEQLESIKIIPQEPFDSVIIRLLNYKKIADIKLK